MSASVPSRASTRVLSEAVCSPRRRVAEQKTPAPRRRMRPVRVRVHPQDGEQDSATQPQLPRPVPRDTEGEIAAVGPDGVEALGNGAFRVGPRPRVVHFDVPGDEEEEEVTYEYCPPGVAAPPSRRGLFLSRPRRRRWLPPPPEPSLEVQIAQMHLRAEIQAQENPPPRTWFGRLIEHYSVKRESRRMYGKRPVSVCQALRSLLCCVRQH